MRERIGARHWLALGVLAQMPNQSIHLAAMGHLLHLVSPGTNTKPTVNLLETKGYVTFDRETKVIRLTELGATRRRQTGRIDTPWFIRVPDSFIGHAR